MTRSIAPPTKPITVLIAFPNMLVSFIELCNFEIHSPTELDTFKTLSPNPVKWLNNCTIADTTFFIIVTPIPSIEKTPLNTDFNLLACSSLILNFSDKLFIFSVTLTSCSTVIGGNTSVKASFTEFKIVTSPSKTFFTESIIIIRPPESFQPCKRLFLASADC